MSLALVAVRAAVGALFLASLTSCGARPAPPERSRLQAATVEASPSPEPELPATPAPVPPLGPPPGPPPVTIAAVGDLMTARRVTTLLEHRGLDYELERVRPLLADADIVVANLEGTFTDRGVAMAKQYTFRTPPALAAWLGTGPVHAVSLANNHTFDFGTPGLDDTLAALEREGVAGFGAGLTAAAAEAPRVLTSASGARVAFLGVDDIGEVVFAAGANPGVARADAESIARGVHAARDQADYVVLFAHWGTEYSHHPTPRQGLLARAVIESGADLVLGAHPHVLQPWQRVGDGVVLYSLGNFVFDLDADDLATLGPGPFQSAVARITLSREAPPHVEFRPVRIDPFENRPRPATAEEAVPILGALRELAR